MQTKYTHWAAQYKADYDANSNRTFEGQLYLVACYITFCVGQDATEHERICRAIAQIAFDQKCGIWHASSVFHGKLDNCMCAPCQRAA